MTKMTFGFPRVPLAVGLCQVRGARQQYPLLAQCRTSLQGILTRSTLVFRGEASLKRLLYHSGTEGVLNEQIRFAQKQIIALMGNHRQLCSFRSVKAQASALHSLAKNTLKSLLIKNFSNQFTIETRRWIKKNGQPI